MDPSMLSDAEKKADSLLRQETFRDRHEEEDSSYLTHRMDMDADDALVEHGSACKKQETHHYGHDLYQTSLAELHSS